MHMEQTGTILNKTLKNTQIYAEIFSKFVLWKGFCSHLSHAPCADELCFEVYSTVCTLLYLALCQHNCDLPYSSNQKVKNVHVPIPGNYEYIGLCGERMFKVADGIKTIHQLTLK